MNEERSEVNDLRAGWEAGGEDMTAEHAGYERGGC